MAFSDFMMAEISWPWPAHRVGMMLCVGACVPNFGQIAGWKAASGMDYTPQVRRLRQNSTGLAAEAEDCSMHWSATRAGGSEAALLRLGTSGLGVCANAIGQPLGQPYVESKGLKKREMGLVATGGRSGRATSSDGSPSETKVPMPWAELFRCGYNAADSRRPSM
jgi:hypothetical protein